MLKNKEAYSKLEDYATRKQNLRDFIRSFTDLNRVNIVEIKSWDDMAKYSQNPEYEGLIVSEETYSNALKLNDLREEKGMNRLILIVIPLIKDKNQMKISSTSIRQNLR